MPSIDNSSIKRVFGCGVTQKHSRDFETNSQRKRLSVNNTDITNFGWYL